jgi:hypothetical protein
MLMSGCSPVESGTDVSNGRGVAAVEALEVEVLRAAGKAGFTCAVTTCTHRVTQQLSADMGFKQGGYADYATWEMPGVEGEGQDDVETEAEEGASSMTGGRLFASAAAEHGGAVLMERELPL